MLTEQHISRLLDLSNTACQIGKVAEARTILDAILALKPDFVPAKISLAFSHIVVDDFSTAKEMLDNILATNAEDADALAMLGLCQLLSGDKSAAEATFDKIAEDVPAKELARVALAEM